MEELINQIKQSLVGIKSLNLDDIVENNFLWNALNPNHLLFGIQDIITILDNAIAQELFEKLPHNIVNAASSQLTTTLQRLQTLSNQRNQNNFNNAVSQVESYRTSLSSWGIRTQILIDANLDEKIEAFDSEYQKIISQKREIEDLKNIVNNLIEPATAGSLSNSFSNRQGKIKTNRIVWLIIVIASSIVSIGATVSVVNTLIETFNYTFPETATAEQIEKIMNQKPENSSLQFLRVAILFPVYSLFVYSFNQYRKERNLEEEYAHRAAVATSLPNYGELAVDTKVKDQIISEASKVVFNSPTIHSKKRTQNTKDVQGILSEVKGIIESVPGLGNRE